MAVIYNKVSELVETGGFKSISSIFREHAPGLWSSGWHNGVDIAAAEGSKIKAAADGVVINTDGISKGDNFGNRVILKHDDGRASLYAHMVAKPLVKVGDKVKRGQLIGYVGGSGNAQHSFGNHLHFTLIDRWDEKPTIYYTGYLLDPIVEMGLGNIEFSNLVKKEVIFENGTIKKIDDLYEYYKAPKKATSTITVNKTTNSSTSVKKSNTQIAKEVIAGDWGNGDARKKSLEEAGYNYTAVQNEVNKMLYSNTKPSNTPNKATIKVGDKVRLNEGAKDYNGRKLASFVYKRDHIVSEVVRDRAVITFGGVVVAAVHTNDLTVV